MPIIPVPIISPQIGDVLVLNNDERMHVAHVGGYLSTSSRAQNNYPRSQEWVNVLGVCVARNPYESLTTIMRDGFHQSNHNKYVVAHHRGPFLLATAGDPVPMIWADPNDVKARAKMFSEGSFKIHHLAQKLLAGITDIDKSLGIDSLWGSASSYNGRADRVAIYLDIHVRRIELQVHLKGLPEWLVD